VRAQDPKRVLRDVGRKIAEGRVKRGLTQEAFAEQIVGCSLKYLQAIEAGRENLTVESLVALAGKVGVRVQQLFEAPVSRKVRRGRPPKSV
jgi:transcriptional regulator with XRE-family HTH domain